MANFGPLLFQPIKMLVARYRHFYWLMKMRKPKQQWLVFHFDDFRLLQQIATMGIVNLVLEIAGNKFVIAFHYMLLVHPFAIQCLSSKIKYEMRNYQHFIIYKNHNIHINSTCLFHSNQYSSQVASNSPLFSHLLLQMKLSKEAFKLCLS